MERREHELVRKLSLSNPTLKKLYERHRKLEKQVSRFENLARYSSSAALKHSQLKKEKLKGVDSIMSIIASHQLS